MSKIEWTNKTWNPITGCFVASAGCTNCYAARFARRGVHEHHKGLTDRHWTGQVNVAPESVWNAPLSWRPGTLVFLASMADVFYEGVAEEMRLRIHEVIARTPRLVYQLLTKRPEAAARFYAERPDLLRDNIWLGTSVEDGRVLERVAHLRSVPMARDRRFLSVEPMIGPVDLSGARLDGIGWVITGGESGPGARAIQGDWVRAVRDACGTRGVPFFHKQWGTFRNNPLVSEEGLSEAEARRRDDPKLHGKGGALLDGRLWREFPAW